jgi:hypothetical protein
VRCPVAAGNCSLFARHLGTNSPYGIRSWKCRIAAASLRGIEIASASLSGQPLLPADLILLLKPTQRQ